MRINSTFKATSYKIFVVFIICLIYFFFTDTTILAASGWVNKGDLNVQRYLHTATVLSDGKVLVVCGGRNGTPIRQSEIFDPTTGNWTNSNNTLLSRRYHTADLVRVSEITEETNVLIAGGIGGTEITNTAELYNPLSNTWKYASNMKNARLFHASSSLNDGRILVTAGAATGGFIKEKHSSTEIYDPISNTWTLKAPLGTARAYHEQVTFKDAQGNTKVMVIGGIDTNGNSEANALATTEIYDSYTNTWSYGPNMNFKRYDFLAITLPDGRVLVVGGNINNDVTSEVYNPNDNSWTVYSASKAFRYGGAIALVGSGSSSNVLASGGNTPDATAQLFNPSTNTWGITDSMSKPRSRFMLTTLKNGSALAIAGASENTLTNTSEVYTPDQIIVPTPTLVPIPSVSPTPEPFLDLPWDYRSQGSSFEQVALNPESWFDT
ncbi:MAG: hypothetical protein H0W89_03050 [Candidatus Levybacteria bacterium]|nr:hypothetical protein [Candidatus Levybacteria bacterium]